MLKRFVAPAVALLLVITGLSFLTINQESLARPSEAEQAYFIKHVPEASPVTEMIRFERKGKMIPNLYVFVDTPSEEFQVAEAYSEPS